MEWALAGFIVFVLGMLTLDLGVFNRKAHVISIAESLAWTSFWITLALGFNVLVWHLYANQWLGIGLHKGAETTAGHAALKFFTGYLIEESLSLDNIFVMAVIFSYFGVPRVYQHRALFWGIMGAIVMRGIMIASGIALIQKFRWTIYVFGAFLLFTAAKMLRTKIEGVHPDRNPLVRLARWFYAVSPDFEGDRFFTRIDGRRAITPLFIVVLVIESSDVLFAVDSIPAILAITQDPFIVFTSNIFAILGLRSLYFTLAAFIDKFRYLKTSLAFVLGYVGVKMLLSEHYHISPWVSLGVLAGILLIGILASVLAARRAPASPAAPAGTHPQQGSALSSAERKRVGCIVMMTTALSIMVVTAAVPQLALFIVLLGVVVLAVEFAWIAPLRRTEPDAQGLGGLTGSPMTRRAPGGSDSP